MDEVKKEIENLLTKSATWSVPLEHILNSLSTRARQNVISDHTDLKSFLELHPNTFDCWKDHEVLKVAFVVKVVKDFPKRMVLKDSSERSNRKITHYELHYPNEKRYDSLCQGRPSFDEGR